MAEQPARKPEIFTITLTNADQEYSQLFPNRVKRFSMQCRSDVDVRFAFETGKVAGSIAPYIVLKSGVSYFEDDVSMNGETLYLASSLAGVVVELLVWK